MTMLPRDETRSVSALISEAFEQVSTLVRGEVNLAQAEMTAKAKSAAVGAGLIGGAALLVLPAIVLLLMALAALLTRAGVPDALSDLIAAIVGFAVSGILAYVGLERLRADSLKPNRTIVQLQKDAATAKGHLS